MTGKLLVTTFPLETSTTAGTVIPRGYPGNRAS